MDMDGRESDDQDVEGIKQPRYRYGMPETNPKDILGSGNEDPFNAFPIDKDQQPMLFLHHCMSIILENNATFLTSLSDIATDFQS